MPVLLTLHFRRPRERDGKGRSVRLVSVQVVAKYFLRFIARKVENTTWQRMKFLVPATRLAVVFFPLVSCCCLFLQSCLSSRPLFPCLFRSTVYLAMMFSSSSFLFSFLQCSLPAVLFPFCCCFFSLPVSLVTYFLFQLHLSFLCHTFLLIMFNLQ